VSRPRRREARVTARSGAYRAFYASPEVRGLFAEVGLVGGLVEDYPVVRAYARREEVTTASWDA